MLAKCSFCDELITVENQGQFFPEDDSYICGICQKEHQKTLTKIKSRLRSGATTVTAASTE
jgi:hypothetical protein